jgi:hypothetical protein
MPGLATQPTAAKGAGARRGRRDETACAQHQLFKPDRQKTVIKDQLTDDIPCGSAACLTVLEIVTLRLAL